MNSSTVFKWNFSQDTRRWKADFSDYPTRQEEIFELDSGVRALPEELGDKEALFITGNNRSDDLFMYFRRFVTGLAPNTTYAVDFGIKFASEAQDGSVGIGGSPGNSVFLKAGVTLVEPIPVRDFKLSIDKGAQSQRGPDSIVLGDIAKPEGDTSSDFVFVERQNFFKPFTFTTDRDGNAWLYFGTDSGFEGATNLFYKSFRAEFTPTSPDGRRINGTVENDTLNGTAEADILLGRRGGDRLTGGPEGDWFLYRGISENRTFAKSRLNNHDVITDFNPEEGDRIALDTDRNHSPDQPDQLFFAGPVDVKSLEAAIEQAFRDRHSAQAGRQSLQANEAVFVEWRDRLFLGVNNGRSRFQSAKDFVVELGSTTLFHSIEAGDSLSLEDYFLV